MQSTVNPESKSNGIGIWWIISQTFSMNPLGAHGLVFCMYRVCTATIHAHHYNAECVEVPGKFNFLSATVLTSTVSQPP